VCIQKFPDWSPRVKTANDTALVSQSSEICRHNPLCCFSTSVCCLFRYRLSPGTFEYTLVSGKDYELNQMERLVDESVASVIMDTSNN